VKKQDVSTSSHAHSTSVDIARTLNVSVWQGVRVDSVGLGLYDDSENIIIVVVDFILVFLEQLFFESADKPRLEVCVLCKAERFID